MTDLVRIRRAIGLAVLALLWVHLPVALLIQIGRNGEVSLAVPVAMALLAALPTAAFALSRSLEGFVRLSLGASLMGSVAALVALMEGHRWQPDMHMYFFAALALLIGLCDWRAILLGTLVTVVHHLVFSMVAPELVFAGGGGIGRVLLHAAILGVEAAVGVWLCYQLLKLLSSVAARTDEALAERQRSETLAEQAQHEAADAQAAKSRQALMVEQLERGIGEVVLAAARGRLEVRVDRSAEDPAIRRLGEGINRLLETFDQVTTDFERALRHLADGDLTYRIDAPYEGKFGELRASLNATVARLASTVATIDEASLEIDRAASEIDRGAADLARRTERQASSIEQTVATSKGLSQSVRQSAARSADASKAAQDASSTASRGHAIVSEANAAMSRIEKASSRINDIIGVIDDIAFQTNLLALNAAVEAARAGDAGRGFAVVAAEVRMLAQRSATAAKDIKLLIVDSAEQVREGVELVNQAGQALDGVTSAGYQVAETISTMSAESRAQATGFEELGRGLAEIDATTQHNAALAEQSAATARTLAERIETLRSLVHVFRITEDASSPSPTRHPALRAA